MTKCPKCGLQVKENLPKGAYYEVKGLSFGDSRAGNHFECMQNKRREEQQKIDRMWRE